LTGASASWGSRRIAQYLGRAHAVIVASFQAQRQQSMPDLMKNRVASLSPRQRQIVRLTSLGCTSHEIAAILGMSRWTVENHQFQAKERLGVSKAALLTRVAIKYKVSPLNDELTKSEQRKLGRKTAR
jgi:DNA-binding CsgD family transcriptional regulator